MVKFDLFFSTVKFFCLLNDFLYSNLLVFILWTSHSTLAVIYMSNLILFLVIAAFQFQEMLLNSTGIDISVVSLLTEPAHDEAEDTSIRKIVR